MENHKRVSLLYISYYLSPYTHTIYPTICCLDQWECPDPKTEVLYHIRPYFVVIFPYIGLKKIGRTYMLGTSNQSVPEMAIDKYKQL